MKLLSRIGKTVLAASHARGERTIAFRSEDELSALQSGRLRAIVRHAWEHVPYYREWIREAGAQPGDFHSADDLRRMPLVDKLTLTLHPDQFAGDGYEHRDGLTLLFSGTSGRRRRFRYDPDALFQALAAGRRQRIALAHFVGKETGYREAVFKRQGGTGDELRRFWEDRMIIPGRMELTRRLFDPALAFEALLAGVNEFRPEVLRGIGSHLGAFLRWVAETGRRI